MMNWPEGIMNNTLELGPTDQPCRDVDMYICTYRPVNVSDV